MVICLERGADLHMAQRIPLPLTVSCFSKIQIGFTFLVPADPGSPGQRAVKRVCVYVCRNTEIMGCYFCKQVIMIVIIYNLVSVVLVIIVIIHIYPAERL